jgi:pilus assembly protein FimV
MLRKSAAIPALFLSFFVSHAFALGLGAVTVESALNQPLRARIAVLQLGATRLDDVRIQVAAPEDFIRFGIERATFLNNIRFRSESTPNGDFVVLTTNQIVREPYLSFILETRWSNGRLLSEHTILLDLPVFQEPAATLPAPVRAPISTVLMPPTPARSAAAPTPQSQSQPSQPSQSVQPVLEPEVISSPDPSDDEVDRSASTADAAAEEPPAQPAPLSQTQEESNSQADAMAEEVAEVDADEPDSALEQQSEIEAVAAEDMAPEPEVEQVVEQEAEQTVTTSDSETLSDIALRVRPNQTVSVQQTMLAIQELNPDAFIGGNINRLRSGQVMRVPSLADIQAIDPRQAIDEVARQNRQIAQVDVQPLAAPANTAPTQDTAAGQLSVITGDDDSAEPSSASSNDLDSRISELETQLALREEEADRARLEKQEMESRLADLNEQIAAAQEIIRLQDLQLAQLQQSLADAAAEAELAAQQAAAAAQLDVPATVIRQPSLLDTILSNTMLLIAGAGFLVLGLVMFLLLRNKATDSTDEDLDEIDGEAFNGVTDKQERDTNKEEAGSEFQDYNDADLDSELDDIISVGAKNERKAPAEGSDLVLDSANDEDICAQADILVGQNNLKQAENLLRAAIEENPDSQKLALKLLAVIAAKGDTFAFEMLADELHSLQDPTLDKKVNELRSGLAVDSPKTESLAAKTEQSSQKDRDDTASFLDDLGIDLDAFDDDSFELADVPEPETKPALKPPAKPSISLEDLPEPEPEEMDLTFDFADEPSAESLGEATNDELESSNDDHVADSNENEIPSKFEIGEQDSADQDLETFAFDEDEAGGEPALAAGASKDADELEIDGLDFHSPSAPDANLEQPAPEDDLDSETFAFDAPAPASDSKEEIVEAPPGKADENSLDFDFDKSELESAPAEIESEKDDELETFDFDLDTLSTDTVVETPDSEEISFDLDEEVELEDSPAPKMPTIEPAADEATVVEAQPPSNDFDFDLSELEIDGDDLEEDGDISLSDDDFLDLGDDEEPLQVSAEPDDEDDIIEFDFDDELPRKAPAVENGTLVDDEDLNFLTDDDDEEIDVSSISIDDDDDDSYAMSDEDETATKLELAYAYQKMGDSEGAKEILLEVIREGTKNQVKEASDLMKTIESSSE